MWYVIHTMSGLEQKCMQQCQEYIDEAAYHEMFIPMYKTKKHFKKEWHEVEKPLFPGYLFVDTNEIEPIMTGLKKFRQYTKLLKDGDVISPVKKEEQDFLALMMDKNHIVQYSEGFLIGDEVYITSGPLRKIPGWIKSVDRHRRTAKMEIPIFGRRTPIEVGLGTIARVSEEELQQMVSDVIEEQKDQKTVNTDQVEVLSGTFRGVRGTFLYADPDKDEWTVQIPLMDTKVKVTFQREEIKMLM